MSDKSTVEKLLKKIEELEFQAPVFKERRDFLNKEAENCAEKRDSLNSEHKKAREERDYYRTKRDQINQEIVELKKELETLKSQIEIKRQDHYKTSGRVKSLLNRTSTGKEETEHLIKALDWKIQTNPLTQTEEAQIIDQIRILEQESLIHKEALALKEKDIESRSEIGALRISINDIRNRVRELAAKSQENHERMLEKIREVERIKTEADQAHQEFVKRKEEAEFNHTKYSYIMKQIAEINSEIKRIEENTRKKRANEELETQAESAYRKLQEKKKLTFEEFQALMEKNRI